MREDDNEEARLFFKNEEDLKNNRSALLAEDHQKALNWEKISVSDHSNKPVADDEKIARQIHSPIHIDENGEITPAAYTDVFKQGLSVDRMFGPNFETVHEKGRDKAEADRKRQQREHKKIDREYIGCVVADVKTIRSILDVDSDMRLFAVYNTALKQNPNHADVFMIRLEKLDPLLQEKGIPLTKGQLKRFRRKRLMEAFGKIIDNPI